MNYTPKTYREDGKYYGRVLLKNGFDYYIGPFKSRSTARRHAIAAMKRWRMM